MSVDNFKIENPIVELEQQIQLLDNVIDVVTRTVDCDAIIIGANSITTSSGLITNEISSTNTTSTPIFLNAQLQLNDTSGGYLYCDTTGVVSLTTVSTDVVLPTGQTFVGNSSSHAEAYDSITFGSSSVLSSVPIVAPSLDISGTMAKTSTGSYVEFNSSSGLSILTNVHATSSTGGFSLVERSLTGGLLANPIITSGNNVTVNGNLIINGGEINDGTNSFTLPASSGQLALVSQIPSTFSIASILDIPTGNVVIGNASSMGTYSSVLTIAATGATLTGNLDLSGIITNGTDLSYSFQTTSGTLAVLSNFGTMSVSNITGITEGAYVRGNTDNTGISSTILTDNGTNVSIGGNLTVTGSVTAAHDATYPLIFAGTFGEASISRDASYGMCLTGATASNFDLALASVDLGNICGIARSTDQNFDPVTSNAVNLGDASHLWKEVFCANAVINTSDKRLKTDIQDSQLGLEFINKLRPVSYKWLNGDNQILGYDTVTHENIVKQNKSVRQHYGFIAQEVLSSIEDLGLSTDDFAGYCYDADSDKHMLRYTEFIAPTIKAVQELSTEVDKQKEEFTQLSNIYEFEVQTQGLNEDVKIEHGLDISKISSYSVHLKNTDGFLIKPTCILCTQLSKTQQSILARVYSAILTEQYLVVTALSNDTVNCVSKWVLH